MQGQGSWYFPLQVCGNICGASVLVFQGIRQSVESAALNINKKKSYYGTFLKVVLMKWFRESNIYIFILMVRN